LWPDRLTATIFPNACRLYRGRGQEIGTFLPVSTAGFDVMDSVSQVLDQGSLLSPAWIDIVVSDCVARTIPLAWQDNLANDEQYEAYARACFDRAGFELEGEWIVHAAYRHFRGTGFGYGLQRSLIMDMHRYLLERGIRLRSVMPISARAYWRSGGRLRGQRSILLLREHNRLSALLFDGKKCAGMQVEPAGANARDAARRLSSVLEAVFPSIRTVRFWTSDSNDDETASVKDCFPGSVFEVTAGLEWN
jgi:hypothetical protein